MTNRRGYGMVLVMLLLCLGACTGTLRDPDFVAPPASSANELDEVLRYYQRIKKMNTAELNKEYEHISQLFAQSKTDFSRVQWALLLSLPNAVFRDEALALNVLKEWSKESKTAHAGLRAFGALLSSLLEEMREKDKRADALQKKLDALKSMEKSLMQRDKP